MSSKDLDVFFKSAPWLLIWKEELDAACGR